jgi:hypothetical protein
MNLVEEESVEKGSIHLLLHHLLRVRVDDILYTRRMNDSVYRSK